jgi:hypothetical protein
MVETLTAAMEVPSTDANKDDASEEDDLDNADGDDASKDDDLDLNYNGD